MKTTKTLQFNFMSSSQYVSKSMVRTVLGVAVCLLLLAGSASAQKPVIIPFDPQGSVGTFPWSISDTGWITGNWSDALGGTHGFVRAPGGEITSFDVPGAAGTQGCEINSRGEIAGCFWNSEGNTTGYRRTPDGKITPIYGAPDAGTGPGQGSMAMALNNAGLILGQDTISDSVQYSLLVTPDNHFITFNPASPSVSTWSWGGMQAALNLFGAAIGGYVDFDGVCHGYVRAPNGAITVLDAPGWGQVANAGTFPAGISPNGTIVGYVQDNNELTHGFIRTPHGSYSTFDVPGEGTTEGSWQGTFAEDINLAGTVTGWYLDANSAVHGFMMAPNGKITPFDAPGASLAPWSGTQPYNINAAGVITGFYCDDSGMCHGFVGLPPR